MKTLTTLAMFALVASINAQAKPKNDADALEKGKTAFTVNCALCHGADGTGDTPTGKAIKARNLTMADTFKNGCKPETIFNTLKTGIPGTGMAAFAHLPEDDRWRLAYYVNSLVKEKSKCK